MNRIAGFSRWSLLLFATALALIFVVGFTSINAQDSLEQPIGLGDVMLGEISLSRITSSYTFTGSSGEHIYLRAQSLTPDFAVSFYLKDRTGNVLADGTHINGQPGSLSMVELPATGSFTIQVQSANGMAGQYTVSVEEAPEAAMRALPSGEVLHTVISGNRAPDSYTFGAKSDGVEYLLVHTPETDFGPSVTLANAETEETVAMFRLDVTGACLRLAPGSSEYILTVAPSETGLEQAYSVLLWQPTASQPLCPYNVFYPAQSLAAEDMTLSTSSCTATPVGNQAINVRAAPNTSSAVIAHLMPGSTFPVLARSANGVWLMVNAEGTVGWIAAPVVSTNGDCGGVTAMNVQTGAVSSTSNSGGNGGSNPSSPSDGDGHLLCVDGDPNNPTGGVELCGELVDTANDVINDPMGVVEDTVDTANDAVDTVNDTVNDVVDTVDDTVNQVGCTIQGLLGSC